MALLGTVSIASLTSRSATYRPRRGKRHIEAHHRFVSIHMERRVLNRLRSWVTAGSGAEAACPDDSGAGFLTPLRGLSGAGSDRCWYR